MIWAKFLLWLLRKSYSKPNDELAKLVLKTAGKYLTWQHQTVYYKDGDPL